MTRVLFAERFDADLGRHGYTSTWLNLYTPLPYVQSWIYSITRSRRTGLGTSKLKCHHS